MNNNKLHLRDEAEANFVILLPENLSKISRVACTNFTGSFLFCRRGIMTYENMCCLDVSLIFILPMQHMPAKTISIRTNATKVTILSADASYLYCISYKTSYPVF
jgi:hypothetical protein